MSATVGMRYVSPAGAEVIVTKGGEGLLTDGGSPMYLKQDVPPEWAFGRGTGAGLRLGERYRSADGSVEALVIRPGPCDLRYDGEPMTLIQPK